MQALFKQFPKGSFSPQNSLLLLIVLILTSCNKQVSESEDEDAFLFREIDVPIIDTIEPKRMIPENLAESISVKVSTQTIEKESDRYRHHNNWQKKLLFNGQSLENPKQIEITGLQVVLDQSELFTGREHLFDDSGKPLGTATKLIIRAEECTIRGYFPIPGADVEIHAAVLRFEDKENNSGQIDLTPMPWQSDAGSTLSEIPYGAHGSQGEDGGSILLRVLEINEPNDEKLRILSKGGNGQSGGRGSDGSDGSDLYKRKKYLRKKKHKGLPVLQPYSKTYKHSTWWRHLVKGTQGTRSGAPGSGGNGGTIHVPTNLLEWANSHSELGNGIPGPEQEVSKPGKLGTPSEFYFWDPKKPDKYELVQVKPAAPLTTPESNAQPGNIGSIEILDTKKSGWITADVLERSLPRMDELALIGNRDELRQLSLYYVDGLTGILEKDREAMSMLYTQLMPIIHNSAAGLDYFGNRPGMVPMLSLEVNYQNYQNEIDSVFRMLFFAHWLELFWESENQRIQGLDWSINNLREDMETQEKRHAQLIEIRGSLTREGRRLKIQIDHVLDELKTLETEIDRKFQKDEKTRKNVQAVLRGLSTALGFASFGSLGDGNSSPSMKGPTMLAVGAGLADGINQALEPNSPVTTGSFGDALDQVLVNQDVEDAHRRFAALNPNDFDSPAAYSRELKTISTILSKASQQQIRGNIAQATGYEDTGRRLMDIKTGNIAFQQTVDRAIELITTKAIFSQKAIEINASLEQHTYDSLEAEATLLDMQSNRNTVKINEPVRRSIRYLRDRAKNRLRLYQYYLARSFEYRLLRPCPVDYRNNDLFEQVAQLFGLATNDDKTRAELAPFNLESNRIADLKAIYESQLREVVFEVMQGLNEQIPKRIITTPVLKLTERDLERLNLLGVIRIDLEDRGVIFDTDRMARLHRVTVMEEQTLIQIDSSEDKQEETMINLELTIEPGDGCLMRWQDRTYAFHYAGNRQADMALWGATWASNTKKIRPIAESRQDTSLLVGLLKNLDANYPVENAYFYPGARTQLIIRKAYQPDNGSAKLTIQSLALELEIHKNKDF